MDPGDLAHLLRRTEFVVRPERFNALVNRSTAEAVDDIMNIGLNGPMTLPTYFQSAAPVDWDQYIAASNWWLKQMVGRPRPFAERMVLFWHGHFTSAWGEAGPGWLLMKQLQTYRTMALGDFRQLTQAMAVSEAMLVYLSNSVNVNFAPNLNFARELMELFTLGVGNYTEADVVAAARAWTGHNYDFQRGVYVFNAHHHDNGDKTFFGTTKNWDGPDIINEILRDNAQKRVIAARFIATKMWESFAHPGPPAGVIDALADVFLSSNLSIRALMRALLLRPEFYSQTAKQGLVRTPIEYMVAICYHAGISPESYGAYWRSWTTGQALFRPPNVAGWKHNDYWLDTSSLNGRAGCARGAAGVMRENGGYDYLNSMTPEAAVDHIAQKFGVFPLSPTSRAAIVAAQRAERAASPWGPSWWAPGNLLTMVMLTPEFNMA